MSVEDCMYANVDGLVWNATILQKFALNLCIVIEKDIQMSSENDEENGYNLIWIC